MQIPSASPKSLQQLSQLARGALLSRGDLPHIPGGHGLQGLGGGVLAASASAKPEAAQGNRRQQPWRTGCHCRLCIPVCEGETPAHPDSWIQKGKRT